MSTPSTTERGYGWPHRKERMRWARRVATGTVLCARYSRPILAGEPWDLGHDDHDRSLYAGPEHRKCNRATATRRAMPPRRSRAW